MKKFLSCLLAAVLLLSALCLPAAAEDDAEPCDDSAAWTVEEETDVYGDDETTPTETDEEEDDRPAITIRSNTADMAVEYGATVKFTVAELTNPVDGASVHWFIDGEDMGASRSFTAKDVREPFTVQAKYLLNGEVLAESAPETVSVKLSLITFLRVFLDSLFRILRGEITV